jgi:CheY-like chemotaxis protein
VLVADDNEDSALSLALLLRTLGQEVHVARNGHDAVDQALALQPDVLILDIGMPGLNGYEVTRRIRRESWGRRPLIVAITGWGQDADRRRSKDAGFDQHLVKPVTLQMLGRLLIQAPPAVLPIGDSLTGAPAGQNVGTGARGASREDPHGPGSATTAGAGSPAHLAFWERGP